MSETIWSRLGMEFDAFYTLSPTPGRKSAAAAPG
jgi:hypothetical protein